MGKQKQQGSVQGRPIYSRISYLYQAASYLGSTSTGTETAREPLPSGGQLSLSEVEVKQAVSRRLLTELRATSHKAQIRLSPAMKHTVCKVCDTLLVEGDTCSSLIENKSKGGKKPWADIMVISCRTCGAVKRFPLNSSRQKRRPLRLMSAPEMEQKSALEGANASRNTSDV
ncbi:RNAse P Rpr2/Rpp21/SNM1 subunit domain-containing protein [Xylariales sp. AK1849]|nr:RNAse P Rpr2/Rpp21/SNM1 subunit domain-containing protein [Xylariales sp. AK1849]